MNRLLGDGISYYHCFSRVVDRRIVFHAGEKEVFRSILRKLERFLGLRVATYCIMGNHFHLRNGRPSVVYYQKPPHPVAAP